MKRSKKMNRQERILARNDAIRAKFKKLESKKCYRVDYMLEIISKDNGFHVEYLRTIICETNATEIRIRKQLEEQKKQLDLFKQNGT